MGTGARGLRVFQLETRTVALICSAAVLAVGGEDVASGSFDSQDARIHLATVGVAAVAAAVCFYAPLLAIVSFSIVVTADALLTVPTRNHGVMLAGLLGCYTLSRSPSSRRAGLGLACVAVPIITVNVRDGAHTVVDGIFDCLVFGTAFVVARVLRVRRDESIAVEQDVLRLDQSLEQEARDAVSAERERIARELHDVVAHNLSVIVMQAGGVRRLLEPAREHERQLLARTESTAREAMHEMRRLLGLLRSHGAAPVIESEPSLRHVGALIEGARASGLAVGHEVEGVPRVLSPGIDVAAYRILQRALANARARNPRGSVSAVVRYHGDELEIEVIESADATGGARGPAGSAVDLGIAERVALYDGRLERQDEGNGRVATRVRLPIQDRAP